MPSATIFKNLSQPVEDRRIIHIINDIKSGRYQSEVNQIRQLIRDNDKENADILKKQLPAFTASGTYHSSRKPEFLVEYSNMICLDFDKVDPAKYDTVFKKITETPHTFACFRSPGGNGIKVLAEVNTGPDKHELVYKQVMVFYEKLAGFPCDPKCKDITRLCFVSYDPNTYINENYHRLSVKTDPPTVPVIPAQAKSQTDFQQLFDDCVRFTEQKEQYFEGNRNNFLFVLASNCNRKGIPESITLDLISAKYDLPDYEIKSIVKNVFRNQIADFAKFANSANLQTTKAMTESEDYLLNTPLIPLEFYQKMPGILKKGALVFSDPRERDVFFTSALSISSGCMPNVVGVYDRQTVFPNLFTFIVAPPASGKGAMNYSKKLADRYHTETLKNSRENMSLYQNDLLEYKDRQRFKKKGDPFVPPPVPPVNKIVFIPANSSYARILYHLQQNEGTGIICETEADTLGNVFKQEWGNYSDMLRKFFHHERISSSKKTNDEYIEVEMPGVSAALSGTPGQVLNLIESPDDGLFSRFLFYVYKVCQVWKDVSPGENSMNLTEFFDQLSGQVYELVNFLKLYPTEVLLSREQWNFLNEHFSEHLQDTVHYTSDKASSIIKRHGLIFFRICMIFTVFRKYEQKNTETKVYCSDDDFILAYGLFEIYLEHSLLMYNNLPSENSQLIFRKGNNKNQFYDALPQTFKRAEAVQIAKLFNISERSVGYILNRLLGSKLQQPAFGIYKKINS